MNVFVFPVIFKNDIDDELYLLLNCQRI